ncbi:MAG: TatD family hydrolase [Anaerolineales bacterium]|jgi:TatD DNase family protein
MLELTDTHCHVNLPEFDSDRQQVFARAKDSGVYRLLIPGVDLESSAYAVQLAESHPAVYAAVGIHPHYAKSWDDDSSQALRLLAASPKVAAIGEVGLDYYRNLSPPEIQRRVFQAQLELASELSLPVIIHQRDSIHDILDTLDEYKKVLPVELEQRAGVLHAFSADADCASSAVEKGFYLGVAGPITFRNAEGLRSVIRKAPQDRILIETDSPYLTPAPHRGERNEPMHVVHVAERLADLLELDLAQLTQITSGNANRLFRWCDETADSHIS